jgi:hypothetical protein
MEFIKGKESRDLAYTSHVLRSLHNSVEILLCEVVMEVDVVSFIAVVSAGSTIAGAG